jgi:hypothetical protein
MEVGFRRMPRMAHFIQLLPCVDIGTVANRYRPGLEVTQERVDRLDALLEDHTVAGDS